MISIATTTALFEKYNALAASGADACTQRNMHQLMMFAFDSEYVDFDGAELTLAKGGLWNRLEIDRISGAEDMGSHMAIVLPSCVLFISKRSGEVRVFLPEE